MRNFEIERDNINIEKLDSDLRAMLGAVYFGLTLHDGVVILHADDAITGAQIQIGRDIIITHDATQQSAAQQARTALQAEIDSLKATIGNVDTLTATQAVEAIQLLYKVLKLNALID